MFGKRLQELRDNKKMTQQQLADLVTLSQQTIDHYEKGRANPSIATINLLANIFQVSSDYLLGRTDNSLPVYNEKETVEEIWPEAYSILLRAGRKPTLTDRRRIAKIMEVAIEYTGEEEEDDK